MSEKSAIQFYLKHFSIGDHVLGLSPEEADFLVKWLDHMGYRTSKVCLTKGEYAGQWGVKCVGTKPIDLTEEAVVMAENLSLGQLGIKEQVK